MKVFILTEGGKKTGFGHIVRCNALWEAFKEIGTLPFFVVNGDNSICSLLKNKKYKIFNWVKKQGKLFDLISGADVVIIDSYSADVNLYKRLSEKLSCAVYVDDDKRITYPRGIVVNGAIYAKNLMYPKLKRVIYLLGPRYMFLRKEFRIIPKKIIRKNIKKIMMTVGGSDSENTTPKILKLLTAKYPEVIKKIIIGKGFRNIKEIKKYKDERTELIYYPDAKKMKNIMLKTDLAISAGGQTLGELARVGVPTIAIACSKDQFNNIKGWARVGFVRYAGQFGHRGITKDILDNMQFMKKRERRKALSAIGSSCVDGNGARRVVLEVLKYKKREHV